MKKFTEAKNLFASLEADAHKFYNKGNSAAGTRVRKGMQDLKNLEIIILLKKEGPFIKSGPSLFWSIVVRLNLNFK